MAPVFTANWFGFGRNPSTGVAADPFAGGTYTMIMIGGGGAGDGAYPPGQGDGGGGGAGGAGGLAGGGTVAVASDPGVFTATYGGDSKRRLGMKPSKKKKKKKDKYRTSGVTKVDRFLRGEPVNQKKSVQEFAQWVVQEARVEMLQLDAKPENVNTNDVNEPPLVASKKSGKVRNPQGRRGNFGMAPGQQGYTRSQYSSHFNKMETITKVLQSQPSVLNLLKALDTDVPMGVN